MRKISVLKINIFLTLLWVLPLNSSLSSVAEVSTSDYQLSCLGFLLHHCMHNIIVNDVILLRIPFENFGYATELQCKFSAAYSILKVLPKLVCLVDWTRISLKHRKMLLSIEY